MNAEELMFKSKKTSYEVLKEYEKLHNVKLPREMFIELMDYISFKEVKFFSDATREIIKNRKKNETDYFTEAIKMVSDLDELSKVYMEHIFHRSRRDE